MIVFSTQPRGGALVVDLDGFLEPGCPALLIGHLEDLVFAGPLIIDVTSLDLAEPEVSELLWRLGRSAKAADLAIVDDEVDRRRILRSWTTLPVLPSVGEALHGHAASALTRAQPEPGRAVPVAR